MDKLPDSEVKKMFDQLAWRLRYSQFEGDFKKRVMEYLIKEGNNKVYASIIAIDLWKSYKNNGMIETYQKYISCEEMINAFIYAIN